MSKFNDDTLVLNADNKKDYKYHKSETELLEDALVKEKTYAEFDEKYAAKIKKQNFASELRKMMAWNDYDTGQMLRKTGISKSYFYQILNDERVPSRDNIINIAIALNCDLDEVNLLLKISEKQELYAKNKRDSVIIYSIAHQYSLAETNKLLIENEEQLLS